MLHGFRRDECDVLSTSFMNVSFQPGTCGYLCPTRTTVAVKPRFYEYKASKNASSFGLNTTRVKRSLSFIDFRILLL